MAKGNMLLGYSKGSVGDVTFYRSGGSQRARARNRNPNNPKTEKQQKQRSRFANAVKFYKQATTNFFRFAYEDKKVNESDYNAFMRHNTLRSGFIGAAASKIANWPAFGAWEVTSGSLPSINVSFNTANDFDTDFASGNSSISTSSVAALSTYVINNFSEYREGDIITVLIYNVGVSTGLPTVDVSTNHTANCGYMQFTLDTSDTTLLSAISVVVGGVKYSFDWDADGLHIVLVDGTAAGFMQVAMIHSRNTADGLLVSTQEMVASDEELVNSALATSGTYYNSVIADWDASANAILQGN